MESLLQVEGINVYYGSIHAIKDISFHVNQGEVVTLIGANGAGKTTTLQTISGLLRSKTGSITFEGHNVSNVRADKLVAHGLAQALDISCAELVRQGALLTLLPEWAVALPLSLVYLTKKAMPRSLRLLIDTLAEELPAALAIAPSGRHNSRPPEFRAAALS